MVANILPSFLLFTQRSGAPTITLPTNNEKQRRLCLTSTPDRCREVFADQCGLLQQRHLDGPSGKSTSRRTRPYIFHPSGALFLRASRFSISTAPQLMGSGAAAVGGSPGGR